MGDGNVKTSLPAEMTADDFAENVLGFEEVEEVEDDEQQQDVMQASYSARMGASGLQNDVIPEEDNI